MDAEYSKLLQDARRELLTLLYISVARKLAGKAVRVEWIAPDDEEARGATVKRAGKLVIQIDPELDTEQRFKTFLHECAHARLHHGAITDTAEPEQAGRAGPKVEPGLLRDLRRAAYNKREAEADAMAAEWYKRAGNGIMAERLRRLLD